MENLTGLLHIYYSYRVLEDKNNCFILIVSCYFAFKKASITDVTKITSRANISDVTGMGYRKYAFRVNKV